VYITALMNIFKLREFEFAMSTSKGNLMSLKWC